MEMHNVERDYDAVNNLRAICTRASLLLCCSVLGSAGVHCVTTNVLFKLSRTQFIKYIGC